MPNRPHGGKRSKVCWIIFSPGKLTNPEFIANLVRKFQQRNENEGFTADIAALRARRSRVIDGFVEGIIDREERERRLAAYDHDAEVAEEVLLHEKPPGPWEPRDLMKHFFL
jgi:hypothetical protein